MKNFVSQKLFGRKLWLGTKYHTSLHIGINTNQTQLSLVVGLLGQSKR